MAAGKRRKYTLTILFIAYLVLLVYFLFFSEEFGRRQNESYQYNLVLFQEITRYIRYREKIGLFRFLINIFGNVIAFMPFGFFLPVLFGKRQKFFVVVSESFLFSLAVELTQLLSKRGSFDVDDMVLNTLGGLLGYISFLLVRFVYRCWCRKVTTR